MEITVSFFDLMLVAALYCYILSLILVSEVLGKQRNLGAAFTRRVIHLFAGDAFLLIPLFTSPWYPALIPIGLALLTIYSFTFKKESAITKSMVEAGDVALHAYGPVYYILSILVLVFLLWERKDVAMSAVMVMAWGDGASSLIPKMLKKVHRYPFGDRSLEGTLSMFTFGFLGSLLAFTLATHFGVCTFAFHEILILAAFASGTGAVVEALTIGPLRHFDNFTVPIFTAFALLLVTS